MTRKSVEKFPNNITMTKSMSVSRAAHGGHVGLITNYYKILLRTPVSKKTVNSEDLSIDGKVI